MDEIFVFLVLGICTAKIFLTKKYLKECVEIEKKILEGSDKLIPLIREYNSNFKEMGDELLFLRTEVHKLKEQNLSEKPKINGEKFID